MFSLLTLLLPEGRIPINVAGDEVDTRGAPPSIWEKLMERALLPFCSIYGTTLKTSREQIKCNPP